MDEVTCRRCGNCCFYMIDGRLKKCKYLVMYGKIGACRVYHNRLNKIIDIAKDGTKVYCTERSRVKEKYEGCPYNEIKQEDRTE